MMRRPVLAMVLVLATHTVARADGDADDTAKALFESASKHYDLREYAPAIADFKKAYALFPEPLFLYDIAQSYRQLEDCESARGFYQRYLAKAPADDNKRDKAERFLAEMETCVADHKAHAQNTTPNLVVAGTTHHGLRVAGLVTAAAGVALLGTGVFFAISASSQASDLEVACAKGCDASVVAPIDQAGKNARIGAIVTLSLGGVAAAAGVGMWWWGMSHAEPVMVTPTQGGAMVSTMVRF